MTYATFPPHTGTTYTRQFRKLAEEQPPQASDPQLQNGSNEPNFQYGRNNSESRDLRSSVSTFQPRSLKKAARQTRDTQRDASKKYESGGSLHQTYGSKEDYSNDQERFEYRSSGDVLRQPSSYLRDGIRE